VKKDHGEGKGGSFFFIPGEKKETDSLSEGRYGESEV